MSMHEGGSKNARAALALRLAGASYTEIAEVVGFADYVLARQAVMRELASHETDKDTRERLRNEEGARIERLIRSVWGKATNPNDPEHLIATRVALSLIDRHARLYGLDAPQEVVVYNPTTAEIDRWVGQLIQTNEYEVVEAEVVGEVAAIEQMA